MVGKRHYRPRLPSTVAGCERHQGDDAIGRRANRRLLKLPLCIRKLGLNLCHSSVHAADLRIHGGPCVELRGLRRLRLVFHRFVLDLSILQPEKRLRVNVDSVANQPGRHLRCGIEGEALTSPVPA